jgi:predicted acylesterase/phospholipase RssA
MMERNRKEWVDQRPLRDFTVPVIALLAGRGMRRSVNHRFGTRRIEDLWLPYFCVTTNLTRAELVVHREGSISKLVVASMSIPGLLPPVVADNGDLLVDGGLLNNVPTDVMGRTDGPVIAVDVSPDVETTLQRGYREAPTPWQLARGRTMRQNEDRRFPSIARILTRSVLVSSVQHSARARHQADLYLSPPVHGFDMFDWQSLERLAEVGYRYASERIAEWQTSCALTSEQSERVEVPHV